VRNVKLLIQDVFKQFDLLFNEIALQQQAAQAAQAAALSGKKPSAVAPQQGINLGELSQDSVKSLTDLLYLPSIDRKLLTALGDFMFRLSSLKDQKSEEKNQRNWSMISFQCEQIGSSNLRELNDLLVGHVVTFSTFGVQM